MLVLFQMYYGLQDNMEPNHWILLSCMYCQYQTTHCGWGRAWARSLLRVYKMCRSSRTAQSLTKPGVTSLMSDRRSPIWLSVLCPSGQTSPGGGTREEISCVKICQYSRWTKICMYFIFSVEILVFSPNIHVLFYKYFSSSVTGFAHSSFALILARLDIRFFRHRSTNTNLRWLFNKCILKEIPMG